MLEDRQYVYNVTLLLVRVTLHGVEAQHCVLCVFDVQVTLHRDKFLQ